MSLRVNTLPFALPKSRCSMKHAQHLTQLPIIATRKKPAIHKCVNSQLNIAVNKVHAFRLSIPFPCCINICVSRSFQLRFSPVWSRCFHFYPQIPFCGRRRCRRHFLHWNSIERVCPKKEIACKPVSLTFSLRRSARQTSIMVNFDTISARDQKHERNWYLRESARHDAGYAIEPLRRALMAWRKVLRLFILLWFLSRLSPAKPLIPVRFRRERRRVHQLPKPQRIAWRKRHQGLVQRRR